VSNKRPGKIGLISNAGSGHNRDQFPDIRERLERCDGLLHRVTASPEEVPAVLQEFAAQGISVLAINGGDGTVSAILGEMLEGQYFQEAPLLVLLPGGTANMTAGDIGIRGKLSRAVERFCRWCEGDRDTRDRLAERRLLRVRVAADAAPHYGMFLGAGAVIHGTEYAHEEIHSRGLRDDFSLALGVIRTVWGVLRDDPAFNKHVTIELSADDIETRQHDTLILAISTLRRLSFGMQPFWGEGPGQIRITVMRQHCTKFLRTFVSIIRGKPNANAIPASGYFSHNTDSAEISLQGKINLDGEIIEVDGRVHIDASPSLEFLKL
jgi:hypothetical protein